MGPAPGQTVPLRTVTSCHGCRVSRSGIPGRRLPRVPARIASGPGQAVHPAREVARTPGIRNPLMINGVPVVAAPAEIDVTTAGQLRTVLLRSVSRGHPAIVVDMTR